MGIWDKVDGAKAGTTRYPFVTERPGNMRLRLKKAVHNQGHEGESFISEWLVMKSEKTGSTDPFAVGTTVSFVQNFSKSKSAGRRVKQLILGMTGYEEANVEPGQVLKFGVQLTSQGQPLRGFDVDVGFIENTDENTGKVYYNPIWKHVPNQKETLARQRKELDDYENRAPSSPPPAAAPSNALEDLGLK